MQTIYLDISNKGVVPTIYAKQGEVGRRFEVVLTDAGIPYNVESGVLFSVWYNGDSGEGNYTDIGEKSAFLVNDNHVVVEIIEQMLANAGRGTLCLVMNKGANQIGVWNIPYICEQVPGFDSEEAKSYYTAFSESVKKIKEPDKTLSVSGSPADAEATGIALSKKAPSGHGLGATVVDISVADLNSTTANGWYRIANDPLTIGGYTANDWYIHVKKYSAKYLLQELYALNGYKLVRTCVNNVWTEKWERPPMQAGVEYMTTELWKGAPVYAIELDFASLPSSDAASVLLGTGLNVISIEGIVYSDKYVVKIGNATVVKEVWYQENTGKIYISVQNSSATEYKACVVVKYTK